MPIFGKSKIGDSCFIDSTTLIGYPHRAELSLLKKTLIRLRGVKSVMILQLDLVRFIRLRRLGTGLERAIIS